MRIHYLSESFIPSQAANSVQVMKMCSAFSALGHEVVLFARRGDAHVDDVHAHYGVSDSFELVTTRRLPVRYGLGTLQTAAVTRRKVARRPPADLIYARSLYDLVFTADLSTPSLFEAHSLPENRIRSAVEAWMFRQEQFMGLVAISGVLKADYENAFSIFRQKPVVVAHDGADPITQEPAAGSSDPDPCPGSWPGRAGRLQVGYVGHLYAGKGMEVVSALAAQMADVDFHVVGGRPRDIAAWRRRGQSPNLHFHGHAPPARVPHYLRRFDVVLAPLQERVTVGSLGTDIGRWTSPLKLFEYMAQGKAIVCSSLPVLMEVMQAEENALVCPPTDLECWRKAIGRLTDPALRRRLGERAKADFLRTYSWQSRAAHILRSFYPYEGSAVPFCGTP